jgi:hypothetical protein
LLAPLAALLALGQEPAPQGTFAAGAFTDPERVESPINSEHWESMGSVSSDGLWIFFTSNRPPSVGTEWCVDLWAARRSSPQEPFGEPTNLGVLKNVNSAADECTPYISVDDKVLTFYSDRDAATPGDYDLYVATRASADDDFGPAVNFSAAHPDSLISSGYVELSARLSCDRLALYFSSNRPGGAGGFDIYVATRDSPDGFFGPAQNLGAVNSSAHEFSPVISPDGLTLFFSDYIPPFRDGGLGEGDIWMATRSSAEDSLWEEGKVRNLGAPINSSFGDFDFFVSHDWPAEGSTIWFTSDRPRRRLGNENCSGSLFADQIWDSDLYKATWIPAKPFRRGDANADGAADIADAVAILGYLFTGAAAPACLETADVADTGTVTITAPVYLLVHLFRGGPAPPPPFESCGLDPTEEPFILSCVSYSACR